MKLSRANSRIGLISIRFPSRILSVACMDLQIMEFGRSVTGFLYFRICAGNKICCVTRLIYCFIVDCDFSYRNTK